MNVFIVSKKSIKNSISSSQSFSQTGASNGIGKAIAYKLASEGYNLFLFARSFDKLQNISDEIKKSHNVKVHIGKGDISNHKDVEMNVNQAIVNLGSIDILINNVGNVQ